VTHTTVDDEDVPRRRHPVEGRLCFYDDDNLADEVNGNLVHAEHDLAYDEADYIYSAMNRRPTSVATPHRNVPWTTRKSPSRAAFDSLRRASVGEKKPLAR